MNSLKLREVIYLTVRDFKSHRPTGLTSIEFHILQRLTCKIYTSLEFFNRLKYFILH